MLILPPETERLAQRLAAAQGTTPATAVQRALEKSAREAGISEGPRPPRMTVEEMLEAGRRVAALPVLDPRSPKEIADDINEA
jgi:antitoxin VapB